MSLHLVLSRRPVKPQNGSPNITFCFPLFDVESLNSYRPYKNNNILHFIKIYSK